MSSITSSKSQCYVCHDTIKKGHSFLINCENKDSHTDRIHRACARRWLQEKETCPLCQGLVIDQSTPIVKRSQLEKVGGACSSVFTQCRQVEPYSECYYSLARSLKEISKWDMDSELSFDYIARHASRGKREAFEALRLMVNFDIASVSYEKWRFLSTLEHVIEKNSSKPATVHALLALFYSKWAKYSEPCEDTELEIIARIVLKRSETHFSNGACYLFSGDYISNPAYLQGVILIAKCSGRLFNAKKAFLRTIRASVIENGTTYPGLLHDLLTCFGMFSSIPDRFRQLICDVLHLHPSLLKEKVRGETASYHFVRTNAAREVLTRNFILIAELLLDAGCDPNEGVEGGQTLFQMLYRRICSSINRKDLHPRNNSAYKLYLPLIRKAIINGADLYVTYSNGESFMSRMIEMQNYIWIEGLCDLDVPWSALMDPRYPHIRPLLRDISDNWVDDLGSIWIELEGQEFIESANFIEMLIRRRLFTPQQLAWYFICADAECSESVLRFITTHYSSSLDLRPLRGKLSTIRSSTKRLKMLQLLSAQQDEADKCPRRKRKVRVSNK